ncbi:MAG: amino acid permease [Verrucomicrobia bacterium]|nr:amino acid permease [Verrucomicrobiota bacterium]
MSESSERVYRLQKKSLKRVLGAWDLFAVGYGDVGSSIYYALGATALYALGATPLAMAIAGFVFICTALTYSELASTFPEPGGSATFSRYAFNDLISFIAGWGLMLDYIVTVAISAFAIPPYMTHLLNMAGIPYTNDTVPHVVSTIVIILVLCGINILGVKGSGRFSFILALFTILTQAMIVGMAALMFLNLPHVISQMKIGVANVDWSPSWSEFLKGTAMAMVAYTGIEAIAQLAAEVKRPAILIPRAVKMTMYTLVVLYFGISVVGLSVISPHDLGTKYLEDPIAGIASAFPVGGQILGPWVGLIAACILLIASNAGLIGCSRLTFSMGDYYQLPAVCYKLHPRFRTPYVSLGIFTVLACLVVAVSRGKMLFLADLYNFGAQIAFFAAHISLMVLRWRRPTLARPYRAPLNIPLGKGRSIPLTAIIGALATLAVWIIVVITKPEGRTLGFFWIGIGLLMFYLYRRQKKLGLTTRLEVERISVPEYHPMHVKKILVVIRASGGTDAIQMACQLAHTHKAEVSAALILEIPMALPMDVQLPKREELSEAALNRAEAIGREYHLTLDLQLVRSRSIESAVMSLIENEKYDLVILGIDEKEVQKPNHALHALEKLFKDAPCRILFCKCK